MSSPDEEVELSCLGCREEFLRHGFVETQGSGRGGPGRNLYRGPDRLSSRPVNGCLGLLCILTDKARCRDFAARTRSHTTFSPSLRRGV